MKLTRTIMATCAVALLMAGCASQPKYAWGNYQESLYAYYKAPSQIDLFAKSLAKTIQDADTRHQKVAPGIYAEYGHILQEQGKYAEAIVYYEKEKRTWPESSQFMDTMIKSVSAKKENVTQEKKS
jgi:hypothetical protein